MNILNRLFGSSKKVQGEKREQSEKKPFRTSFWEAEPSWAPNQEEFVRRVKQLLDASGDEARLELTELVGKGDPSDQLVAVGLLGIRPVTPNKIAVLSVLMFSKEPPVAGLARRVVARARRQASLPRGPDSGRCPK